MVAAQSWFAHKETRKQLSNLTTKKRNHNHKQVPKHALLMALDHRPTPDLAAFCAVLATLQQGARVTLQFRTASERRRPSTVIMHVDWRWCGTASQSHRAPSLTGEHAAGELMLHNGRGLHTLRHRQSTRTLQI